MENNGLHHCPVCGNSSGTPLKNKFCRCECGVIYATEWPEESLDTHSGDWADARLDVRKQLLKSARNKLGFLQDSLSDDARILEVGCGTGEFLEVARDAGYEVVGVEANPDVADYLKENIEGVEIHQGVLREVALNTESFEGVFLSHLIEHIPDPAPFLSTVHKLLREDGIGYIGTPNAAAYQNRGIRSQWGGLNVLDHKVLYTPRTLPILLEQNRLQSVDCWSTTAGYDVAFSFRSFLLDKIGIEPEKERISSNSQGEEDDRNSLGVGNWWELMKAVNGFYTETSHQLSPLIKILFYPYFWYLNRYDIGPMLHCKFEKS